MADIVEGLNKAQDIYSYITNLTIDNLEKVIIYANHMYYNEESVMSDVVFDMIRDFLNLKSPNSKILKIVGSPVKSKNKVKLPYYLGSMDKIKPPSNKLKKWKTQYNSPYVATDKLDGVSALLVYGNNNIHMYTRGTATHGQDITMLLRYMKKIPKYDDVMIYLKKHKMGNMIALRGELIISKKTFAKTWSATLKNARNAVGGLVNSKHINPELARDTSVVLYQIIDPVLNMTDQLKIIKELGFNTVHSRIFDNINFKLLSEYLKKRKTKSRYTIDGIIITNDDVHDIVTNGNPEHAWAFKDALDDMMADSQIIDIEWNQSKDGNLIPTIIIMPINIGGVTIQRITGNNARYIVNGKLGVGAKVQVIRSNDVIPKIERVIQGAEVILPDGDWDDNMVHITTGMITDNIKIKNIYYFFSTIGTVGMGEKIVEKFYNAGYDTIPKILQITKEDILQIDGFKEKSAENIIKNITTSTTNIPLAILMKASNKLGRGMGKKRAKDVLLHIPDIMTAYINMSQDEFIIKLKKINGWEEKTSKIFALNFKHFIDFYNSIKKNITLESKELKTTITGSKYKDMKIVMSDFRDINLIKHIEENGGVIQSGVSKNTTILIIKDNSVTNTSKVKIATKLGITVLTKDKFITQYVN